MTLADKIVVLRAGIIEQVGAPLELYDDPDNLFVAGFIGSPRMNFLEAEVTGKDGGVTVKLLKQGGVSITLPLEGTSLAIGDPCQLGIRPEHLSRTEGTMLTLNVDVAEHLGGESYLYAASAQGESLTIETKAGREARHGSTFEIGIPAASAFLFDTTEKRVR